MILKKLNELGCQIEKLVKAEGSEAAMSMCLMELSRTYLELRTVTYVTIHELLNKTQESVVQGDLRCDVCSHRSEP